MPVPVNLKKGCAMGFVRGFFEGLWHDAESYGVSPQIFIALYLITWPMWYYTMWWVASGWHRQDRRRMRLGVWTNRVVTVTPYVYVMVAGGQSMSWKWWAFTVVLPVATTSWFLHKIKDDEWMEKWWETYQKHLNVKVEVPDKIVVVDLPSHKEE